MDVSGTAVATGSTAIHDALEDGWGCSCINSARPFLPAVVHATLLVDGWLLRRTTAEKAHHLHGKDHKLEIWNYLLCAGTLVRQHRDLLRNGETELTYASRKPKWHQLEHVAQTRATTT